MANFVNNPNGLSKTVLTPEVRAQSEAEARSFTRLLGKMNKKGLSFNGDDAFIDSSLVKHYDKYGTALEQPQAPAVVTKPAPTKIIDDLYDQNVAALDTPAGPVGPDCGLVGPDGHSFGSTARNPAFIAPPIQQVPPAITINNIVHQFKIYDPVQQQILITILNQ